MKTSIFLLCYNQLLNISPERYTTMIYKEKIQKPPCSAGGGVGPLV